MRNDLREKLGAVIFNKHGGGSVSSRCTVDSILDAIMPVVDAAFAEERNKLGTHKHNSDYLDCKCYDCLQNVIEQLRAQLDVERSQKG